MPAPISPRAAAFSSRIERMPFCARPSAAARPPMPPPAIRTGLFGRPHQFIPEMFERVFGAQRHPRGLVVEIDQLRHQRQQRLAVGRFQRLQHPRLGALDRRHDFAQQRRALFRHVEQLCSLVPGRRLALDIVLGHEPLDHAAERGAIECDDGGKPRRIDAWMGADRDQRGILHRRQVVRPALLDEDRHRDLLHPAEQIAGRGVDRVHGDGSGLIRHRAACRERRPRTP